MRLSKRTISAAAAAACMALALGPAAARANLVTLGSDLSKDANVVEDHGADSLFWNTSVDGNPNAAIMPADGQVTVVKVKGTVVADPFGRVKPDPQFHFQVIHPIGGGRWKVMLSSGAFRVPVGGNPQVVNSFNPINLCVQKGDVVDFNDIGGFEWRWANYRGMPFQVFSAARESSVNFYSADNGTNIGSQWAPQENHKGEELLMQTLLATGADASDICPGGFM